MVHASAKTIARRRPAIDLRSTIGATALRGGVCARRSLRSGARRASSKSASIPWTNGAAWLMMSRPPLPAGHYLAEEVPELVCDELEAFFR
jgi:hypothetical protein